MKSPFPLAGGLFTLAQLVGMLPVLGQLPAVPTTATVNGPRIKFAETAFDFGKIRASEVVRHEFLVTNTGNAVLEITAVRPGCPGCTTALPWDRQIQPGQTGRIPIQFNPASFSGPVSKSVTVTCNDPVLATQVLQFRATIWQPIDVQPAYVYFMPVEGEFTNDTKIVRIVSHLDEPLTLEPPQCANRAFQTELKTIQPGKEFALHISYSGPVSNSPPQGQITINTSSTNVPTIKVSAHSMLQPALALMPAQITLPNGPMSNGHRHTQVIRNNSSTPMKLTEAAVNSDGVTVQINESQPGKLFILNLNFPANFQLPSGPPLELTVKTTHPKRPLIKIPIVQAVVPASAGLRAPTAVPAVAK